MELNQWQQIKKLYQSALTQPLTQRDDFVTQVCEGDEELRQGLTALLTLHQDEAATRAEGNTTRALTPMDEEMTPERWQRIEGIFQGAADCQVADLPAYLERACGNDEALRREVEALLAFQQSAPSFIQGIVHNAAAAITPSAAKSSKHKSRAANDEAMFVPGAVLAGRYRIIGPLGRGGMGAVYRADDLKLGQPVALKFLTAGLARDGAMLARFHGEVRVARQVTHPNVCRVHDIGEIRAEHSSQHFLSMEYVDGEDLSSLLRRIGRLPADKAVEIARQLCAGLAAAHEAGVLHRDLKPANVMIDGRGRARITDFGLAGLAEQFRGREVLAGTPAYMAPEQLAGKEVTVKSDIYALGLVLYELFTGRRVFDAHSFDELRQLHESSAPTNPSSWVKDIDPLVERVILRCLEKDPVKRPASAVQVAAALPGGDPLAAAIAAGETPSPEMVAAAPKAGGLRPAAAVAALASVVAGLIVLLLLSQTAFLHNRAALAKPPEVLLDRAANLLKKFGHTAAPANQAYGFEYDWQYMSYLGAQRSPRVKWDAAATGQPPLLYFWHRQSPQYLMPQSGRVVSQTNPPLLIAGMTELVLDPRGQLVKLQIVPPQVETITTDSTPAPDWQQLFEEAGLDINNFQPVTPQWTPPFHNDARAAWEGVLPAPTAQPVRIEAAAYKGQPSYFEIIGAWRKPERAAPPVASAQLRAFQMLLFVVFLLALLAGALLARRNLRLGRGDRQGAYRVAAFTCIASVVAWIFGASHVPTLVGEVSLLSRELADTLLFAGMLWLFYIALEPYVRRRWPERIIAWSRLLAGGWRDPLIGRDVLLGMAVGIWVIPVKLICNLIYSRLAIPATPLAVSPDTLLGVRGLVPMLISNALSSLLLGLGFLLILLLLAMLLRRDKVATVVLWLLYTVGLGLAMNESPVDFLYFGLAAAMHIFLMMRFGLLAFLVAHFTLLHSEMHPFTTDFSAWYASYSHLALLTLLIIAAYGFYTALAGQPLFKRNLLEAELPATAKP
jgi:hypothetical protein